MTCPFLSSLFPFFRPFLFAIEGLLEAMSTAVYAFGNNTHQELGNVTTLASGVQSTTTAVTVGRNVHWGDAFFGRGYNRVATLLHEALHVFWNTASLPHLPGAGRGQNYWYRSHGP